MLTRNSRGHLLLTDDFLRAYLARPEIYPVAESCVRERALHARLLEHPGSMISEEELAGLADPDARDNYRVLLRFFELLTQAESIESCYAAMFSHGDVAVPPLFIDQLAHVIVRGVLEGTSEALEVRAAELFFREQKATVHQGQVLLADMETLEARKRATPYGNLGRLLAEAQVSLASNDMEILGEANSAEYWDRNERHDFVLPLGVKQPGARALCSVLEKWIAHFFAVDVSIRPVTAIDERQWAWHIGLDAEANTMLNDLWHGEAVEQGRLARLLALFLVEFASPADMRADVAGRPVYLGMAMNEDGRVRVKPQNLLVNLPLAASS